MAIDVQSELRRPVAFSLAVIAAVLLIWLLIASVVSAKHRRSAEERIGSLQADRTTLTADIDRMRAASGTLETVRAQIAAAEHV
jgi:hypothetical protein